MNICICPTRGDGTRRCRSTRVNPEPGELTCAVADALALALAANMTARDRDGTVRHDMDIEHDVVGILREARGQGWTIRAPRRRRSA